MKNDEDSKKADSPSMSPAQRARFRVIIVGGPALMGSLILIYTAVAKSDSIVQSSILPLFGVAMVATSGLMAMMIYLQSGSLTVSVDSTEETDGASLRAIRRSLTETTEESLMLREQVQRVFERLSSRVDELASANSEITAEERQKFLNDIEQRLRSEASESMISDIEEKVEKRLKTESDNRFLGDLLSETEKTEARLTKEVAALARRGNLNLAIGIVITLLGLGLLGFTVYAEPIDVTDLTGTLSHYLPRVSLVIFIEVFAYFFLRLYKSSLGEIKYFQNELTGVEARYIALKTSLGTKDAKILGEVITTLAAIDRNSGDPAIGNQAEREAKQADGGDKNLKSKIALAEKVIGLIAQK